MSSSSSVAGPTNTSAAATAAAAAAAAANHPEQTSPMPVWLDDTHLDPAWIHHHTQVPCTLCIVQDISNEMRRGQRIRDGATLKLAVFSDDQTLSLVVKQVPPQGQPLSQQLGLAREALFFNQLSADVKAKSSSSGSTISSIPKIYYAYGDMVSGAKVIIMEDLSQVAVDSGVFFGPGNPNNWKRDLQAMAGRAGNPTPPTAAHVAKVTFIELAQVHAAFWCRKDLLQDKYSWMRGHQWLQGKGKETWEASQSLVQNFWKAYLDREQKETTTQQPTTSTSCLMKWDPLVREAVEAAVKGISWEAQLERLNVNGRWCVVHGDCWPGNFMWKIHKNQNCSATTTTTSGKEKYDSLSLLDWEMVGLGSGPQDLGQYVLSNFDPVERRECEHDLIRSYLDELQRCGVKDVDWEYCWSEYKFGGLERWLWFLIYFVEQEGMLDWAQFFHNQMACFMHDHNVTVSDIVQPRP